MKKNLLLFSLLIFLMITSLAMAADKSFGTNSMVDNSAMDKKSEQWIITSLDFPPYSGVDIDNQGTSIKILKDALRAENIELIVEFLPWARAKKTATGESYSGFFPAWPEEVDEGFTASVPIDKSSIAVMKQAGTDVKFSSIFELFQNYKVGIVQTYIYPEVVVRAMKIHPANVDKAPGDLTLMRKTAEGRHPVLISDPRVISYLSVKDGRKGKIELVSVIEEKPLVLAFKNDNDTARKAAILKSAMEKYNKK